MANAPKATIDFETRSACPIRRGPWRYATHPSTEIMCLVFRLPHWAPGRTSVWHPAWPALDLPERIDFDEVMELFDWIEGGGLIECWNVWFEFCVWMHIMVPKFGWCPIPLEQFRCAAAKAAAHALPRALEDAGPALKLALTKDVEGSKVMKKMMKPRKSWKKERVLWAKTGQTEPKYLWHETVDMLDRLIAYCRIDVLSEEAISHVLDDLSEQETEMFLMDLRINARGFQIDKNAVKAALRLITQETIVLNQELTLLTDRQVRKATQRARMLAWFAEQGLELFDTQKATIDQLLSDEGKSTLDALDPKVRRALEIVRALGRSSTAKFKCMKDWMARNGRVYGGLLYHGASTGRWSGKGVQPHNFPKPTQKLDIDEVWKCLKRGKRDEIVTSYRSVMEALANALRGAITASRGNVLYVADYASIEARVLLWLAGEEDALELFRQGKDIYLEMATAIYGYVCNKEEHPTERQIGKQACLGPDTLVLTQFGYKKIIQLTPYDHLWDGVAWVSHEGTVCSGLQQVISLSGIFLTPDHLVLTGKRWKPASVVARSAATLSRALATASVPLPSRGTSPEYGGASVVWSSNATVETHPTLSRATTCTGEQARVVMPVPRRRQPSIVRSSGATPMSSQTLTTANDCSIELQRSSIGAKTPTARHIFSTVAGVFASIRRGLMVKRDDVRSWPIWSHCQDGITQILTWTGWTTIGGMHQTISDLLPAPSTHSTSDRFGSSKNASLNWSLVYDVVNAGPRHRFTVLTEQGPLIVHNCLGLGYQMGASKFAATCAAYGIEITEEFAKQVVDAYRAKFWRVKALWSEQEAAAIKAVRTGKRVFAGRMTWFVQGRFLYCQLPSGRKLAYPYPELNQVEMSWGGTKESLTFMGVDGYTRKWKRQKTYGGMIVENQTQAVARDLMAFGMLRVEKSETYQMVLSVHDEGIAEATKGTGSVTEFEHLLTECPDWAEGCPIAAEGFTQFRYKK